MSNKNDDVDFLIETAKQFGVAASTVNDGHVLVFSREHMQNLIDQNKDHEMMVIFLKRPDFQSSNSN